MPRLFLLVLVVYSVSLTARHTAYAATAVRTITRQKTAGPYRLLLKIGPPLPLTTRGISGRRVLGGQRPSCYAGRLQRGMKRGTGVCNHHIELHVYQAKGGHVITHARIRIKLLYIAKHTITPVPIMTLENPRIGSRDIYFGNNLHARAGHYTVTVLVNSVVTVFSVQLH